MKQTTRKYIFLYNMYLLVNLYLFEESCTFFYRRLTVLLITSKISNYTFYQNKST